MTRLGLACHDSASQQVWWRGWVQGFQQPWNMNTFIAIVNQSLVIYQGNQDSQYKSCMWSFCPKNDLIVSLAACEQRCHSMAAMPAILFSNAYRLMYWQTDLGHINNFYRDTNAKTAGTTRRSKTVSHERALYQNTDLDACLLFLWFDTGFKSLLHFNTKSCTVAPVVAIKAVAMSVCTWLYTVHNQSLPLVMPCNACRNALHSPWQLHHQCQAATCTHDSRSHATCHHSSCL